MRTPTYKFLNKWLSSTDGWLRDQGEAGIELAKFFNNKSAFLEETGFHQAKTIMFNRLTNKLGAIFEMDVTEMKAWDDPLVEEALSLAEDERITDAELAARTDEAAQKAVLVRKLFSDIFDQYIVNPKTKIPFFYIKKRRNYAPRMLDFVKIEQNQEAFVDFLRQQGVEEFRIQAILKSLDLSEYSEDFSNFTEDDLPQVVQDRLAELREQGRPQEEIQQIIDSSLLQMSVEVQRRQRTAELIDDALSDLEDEEASRKARLSPGMDQSVIRSLQDIPTAGLRNAIPGDKYGFLVPPGLGMVQYFHQVTRKVEFERRGGFDRINQLLEQIPEEDRGFAEEIVQGNLGKRGAGMGKGMRTFNSIAAVHTVSTTLLFTVLASITDLSGIAVRMKEAQNLEISLKKQ